MNISIYDAADQLIEEIALLGMKEVWVHANRQE